jgi:hypothetical protein
MSPSRLLPTHFIRNDLCSGCGRWHDHTGESLLGWTDWHGRFWPLPRGHMPSHWPFDDSGGRSYGFCVMGGST